MNPDQFDFVKEFVRNELEGCIVVKSRGFFRIERPGDPALGARARLLIQPDFAVFGYAAGRGGKVAYYLLQGDQKTHFLQRLADLEGAPNAWRSSDRSEGGYAAATSLMRPEGLS